MKKHFLKTFTVIIALLMVWCCTATTVMAEAQTTELFTLESTRNMGISVAYTTEPPEVEFIAPDGEIYGTQAINSGKMTRTDSGTALFFRIPNAQAGTWQVKYDKKSNSEIEINYAPYAAALSITDFSFTKTGDDTLEVSFLATHSSDLYYEYKIYAALVDGIEVVGQKEISSGGAYANDTCQTTVYIDNLSTYANYRLMLEVSAEDNGLQVFDSKVADGAFEYVDPDPNEAPSDFYLETDVSEGSIRVDWTETFARGNETIVAIYYNDATEPSYYNVFESDNLSTEVVFDIENTQTFRVDVSYKDYSGKLSNIASRVVDVSTAKAVTINCEDITASAQAEIVYNLSGVGNGPFKAVLKVNDNEQELSLQGDDSFSVQLLDFNNEVSLLWYYDEFTAFVAQKEIYSDRLAPSLNLPDASVTVKTDKAFYVITGTVDPGCTVTINGNAVTVDENGIFTTKLDIVVGENIFTVIATGPNGNNAQQTVVVERVVSGAVQATGRIAAILQYLPLIAGVIFALAVGVFVLTARKSYLKRSSEKGKRIAVLLLLRAVSIFMLVVSCVALVYFIVQLILTNTRINSVEFYDIIVASGVQAGYALIKLRRAYIIWTIIAFVCIILFITFVALFTSWSKKPPKERKPKPPKAPKERKSLVSKNNITTTGLFCGSCGKKNEPGAKFCEFCGESMEDK